MEKRNKFDESFELISKTRDESEDLRSKLVEGSFELNRVKKVYVDKQKEADNQENNLLNLKATNRELKVSMVKAIIERDELEAKKNDLQHKLHKIEQDIDNFDRQSDYILRSVGASHHPQNKN